MSWDDEILCEICKKTLPVDESDSDCVICTSCQKQYTYIESETFHASANSGTTPYYEMAGNFTIKRGYFVNQPRDLLDEAYQKSECLSSGEKRSAVLIPIIKNYYDSMKKRIQSFLVNDYISNLTQEDKEKITNDSTGTSGVVGLIGYLKIAIPSSISLIDQYLLTNSEIVSRMKWIRDKYEHIPLRHWPDPARIYVSRQDNPDSARAPLAILDYSFLKDANKAAVDLHELLLKIDPVSREANQLDILKAYRLV